MNKNDQQLRSLVAQGWTTMFIVFLANLSLDVIRCIVVGDFSKWAKHLGLGGMDVIAVVMAIYALMPLLIRAVSDQWFKYVTVGVTVFMGLFVLAHEASHLVSGDKPFGIQHALDITHHLLAISTTVAAALWARRKPEQTKDESISPLLAGKATT